MRVANFLCRCVIALLALAGAPHLFSLNPNTPIDRYIMRSWTTKEGLPQNTVYDIKQDVAGYIWLGTDGGLVRFDGINFKIFNAYNTDELTNNSVTCLCPSTDGTLWVGTFGGVLAYKNGRFKRYHQGNGLPNNMIWEIKEDSDQNIWIGTTGGGLVRFKEGEFKTYTTAEGLSDNIIKAIHQDSTGKLWIGTEKGLTLMENGNFTTLSTRNGLVDNVIMSISEDREHNLWIGTSNGLSRLSRGRFTNYRERNGLNHNLVHDVFEDKAGNIWIANEGGLNRLHLRENRIESLTVKEGLSDNSVLHIFEDREENLWIGTSGNGLNKLHDSKFTFFTVTQGLPEDTVRAIFEDGRGTLWIGSKGGGLSRLKDGRTRTFNTSHGLSSNFINSVLGDSRGRLWIGTQKGLDQYRDGVFSHIPLERDAADPAVISLFEDARGNLWVGTYGNGLYLFQGGRRQRFTSLQGLANDFILAINEDKTGVLWIGTNGGLTRLTRNEGKIQFKNYSQKDGLSNNMVYDIHVDGWNNLWIGTNGGGLNRMAGEKFSTYTMDDGLLSNVIYRILEDDRGNLWMSSNRGVFSVSKGELDKLFRGEVLDVKGLYFQEADGLTSSVCCGGFQPAGWKGGNGMLYLPTSRGVAVIHPAWVSYNTKKPPVLIEKVLVDGKEIDFKQKVKIPAGVMNITIYYNALSYTIPEKVKFSYKLSGHDPSWIETHSREPVTYERLKPGDYSFKVIAGNNDEMWNFVGATFAFTLSYRFYEEIWFQFLVFFILLFSIFMVIRSYKSRRLLQLDGKGKYQASTLEPWAAKHYLRKIISYMENEKPYMDAEITVDKLAKMVNLSEKHLSQILNERLDMNFNNFINKYRVQEAQRKLLDPREKDFVLLKIAFDVGFNSKSAFNAAFKKYSGMSPSEYRKKHSH